MTSPFWNGATSLPQSLKGQRILAAIAFTDGVSFSARMALDEAGTTLVIQRDLDLMARLCHQFEGHVIKSTGDGLMMYFPSAVKAVECAVEIQRQIAALATQLPPQEIMAHRIGIHLGDVAFSGADVMGSGVNIAARLQTKADPGGICISQTVYDVVKSQLDLKITYMGPQELKNIRDPIPAYQILVAPNMETFVGVPATSPRAIEPELPSPYKGLKKFELEDRERFFGRDQLIASLVNELEQFHLILLLGASGSGKSSLIRAGVIPRFLEKWGKRLVVLILTPDENPFESLYASLLSRYKQSDAKVVRQERTDALLQAVKLLKQPEEQWLIYIDQFEELFTITPLAIRDRFIDSLTHLLRLQDSSINVILTMRADFLDRFSAYPQLGKQTQKLMRLITDMQRDELWLAIKQPAARLGVAFESGLIEEILRDVQGQAGYLPLLQYTLDLLWESERQNGNLSDRMLHSRTYRELGGVRGALQKRVDQFYDALSGDEQAAVRQIFLRLVTINGAEEVGGGKAVSRRAYRAEFTGDRLNHTLDELINQNLLVSNEGDRLQPTVEIAHEALLDSWQALKDWIADAHQVITIKNRLAEDVAHWQSLQRSNSHRADEELWSGSKLESVLELRREKHFDLMLGGLSPEENQFVDTSVRRRDRQRRRTITGLAGFAAIALSLSVLAVWQSHRAESQRRQAITGQIDTLSLSSNALFASNQELGSLVEALKAANQMKAAPWTDTATATQVRTALQKAIYGVREFNQLQGHLKAVNAVSYSPDGNTLASASDDGTIKLWSRDGHNLKTLEGHHAPVYSLSFSPDGKLIASASADHTIRLWRADGQPLRVLKGHTDAVNRVSFSPNGLMLASGSDDRTVRLWAIDGRQLRTLQGHAAPVWGISFSPDGTRLASASNDRTIRLWTLNARGKEANRPPKVLKGHSDEVNSVSFSPNGQFLASASNDKTIKIWSAKGERLRSLKGHNDFVNDVRFSPDGKTLASSSWDNTVKLWSLQGEELATFKGHHSYVWGVSFSPDGKTIASAGADAIVRVWRLVNGEERTILKGHSDNITSISISPNGQLLASASNDNTVRIWSMNGQELKTLRGHQGHINSVSFAPSNNLLASASEDGTIKLWTTAGRALKTLRGHSSFVNSVAISPDGKLIASGGADNRVILWSIDGRELKRFQGHSGPINRVVFSPNSQMIASASADRTVKLWSVNGQELKTLPGHNSFVNSVTFSPDGQKIASASADGTVKLWTLDGQELQTLKGHTGFVNSVSFSPNGTMLASAGADSTVKLWALDGRELKTLEGHSGSVQSVRFNPDGKTLASASEDRTIRIWSAEVLEFDRLVQRGCNWLHDYLQTNPSVKEGDRKICQS
jgi:WD40 repeat protein/class 3 adenylate cyclase